MGLKAKVITPDVLVQPHSASLQLVFHEGSAFAAAHGSWNRNLRTGYKVIRVPFKADGTDYPAGTFLIPGDQSGADRVKPAVEARCTIETPL